MADALFRASVRGARRAGFQLNSAGRELQSILLDEFGGQLVREATRSTRAFAPHRRGRLERGIRGDVRSHGGRITLTITSTARSDDGFDYLPITRFGHRVARIYPKKARALKFVPLGAPAGRPIYRAWVRGYRPGRDWVDDAFHALDHELDQAQERIGRAIDRRLLR